MSLLIMLSREAFATAQVPDRLIYNGDTLSIFTNPLEQLYESDSIRPDFFGIRGGCSETSCWRGYVAEWKIKDDQLYLTDIFSCCYRDDSVKADLYAMFGNKVINGEVKAEWFSGYILAPKGELLYYVHMDYGSLYEIEQEFQFKNGRLTGAKIYDNSKSRRSIYTQVRGKLSEFIYANIKWGNLPPLNGKEIKVFLQISANENGLIDSVTVMRGYTAVFDQEAMRIAKSIPQWDVFYRHGEFERITYQLGVVFSRFNRKKYNKRVK